MHIKPEPSFSYFVRRRISTVRFNFYNEAGIPLETVEGMKWRSHLGRSGTKILMRNV